MIPLPIDPFIEAIRSALARTRAVVVTAEPGAGKTTRLPPALLDTGPAIVLQPRRAAARAVAARICEERGWSLGRQAGYHVRFDRRWSADTQLLVVTEGILTARLQVDPLLSDFSTVIIDEFHERSIHADLALALTKQAWRARDDLRIVVMSATLDVRPVSRFLDGCSVVEVPGRTFPVDISYAPGAAPDRAAAELAMTGAGDVLCFMPGASEIRRTVEAIAAQVAGHAIDVLPLHGGLSPDEQARAIAATVDRRTRVIVATNIAETSLTVPGVTAVVDAGLQKVARYDAQRGIDSLVTERISQDAADQRAGRAGRVAAGRVVRLWDARDRLRAHRDADIHRIDLAAAALDVFAWGGHPSEFDWYEKPRQDALASALRLLERLGALRENVLTEMGKQMHRIPVHPRLARLLIAAGGAWPAVQACALLTERHYLSPRTHATTADLLSAIDSWETVPPHVQQVAGEIERHMARLFGGARARHLDDAAFRQAMLAAYPDRVGQRRAPGSARVKLASGTGAVMGRQSGVTGGEFLVALDVRAPGAVSSPPGAPRTLSGSTESVIRIAALVEPEWLAPNGRELRHWFDAVSGEVRAVLSERYDSIVLRETPVPVDPDAAVSLLADAWLSRGLDEHDERLLRRLRFAGHDVDLSSLVASAVRGRRSLQGLRLSHAVAPELQRSLDRDAPETLPVPSGRQARLDYTADGGVTASVKLQELFGWRESPRLGPARIPVLLALLSPGGRPVQMTRDLASFWDRTYPEVRRELRGRYPKHPWPEDPWHAMPTAKTSKRQAADQIVRPGKKTR